MVVRNHDLFSSALTTNVERPMYNTVVSTCGGASFCNRAGHTHLEKLCSDFWNGYSIFDCPTYNLFSRLC